MFRPSRAPASASVEDNINTSETAGRKRTHQSEENGRVCPSQSIRRHSRDPEGEPRHRDPMRREQETVVKRISSKCGHSNARGHSRDYATSKAPPERETPFDTATISVWPGEQQHHSSSIHWYEGPGFHRHRHCIDDNRSRSTDEVVTHLHSQTADTNVDHPATRSGTDNSFSEHTVHQRTSHTRRCYTTGFPSTIPSQSTMRQTTWPLSTADDT